MEVVVDSRERNSDLIDALERGGISVSVRTLHVGDYAISERVCIERKTARDFESSIISGRLFEQAERLREHYPSAIVIIEGNDFTLKENTIIGTIAHLYIEFGVQVLESKDAKDTARLIAFLAKHEQEEEKREPSMKGGARSYTDAQYQERVVANLPGVGPKTARALLHHFGSVKRIAEADAKELREVENIGKVKSERLFGIINERYISRGLELP